MFAKIVIIKRPILRGRDIKKYGYEYADLWLINTHNGVKEKGIKPVNINDYVAVKKHLDLYLPQLGKRQDKGDTFYNLRNCAYIEDFSKQKIVWKIIGDQMAFFIDTESFMVNNACYILTGKNLEYLVAVMNSKIIKWYSLLTNMNKTGIGDMQVGAQNVNLFPVPQLSESNQKPYIDLVERVLISNKTNQNSLILQENIEKLVYDLYSFIFLLFEIR